MTTEETFARLTQLKQQWYNIPGFSCGGPLHIVLDDDNLEDCWLEPIDSEAIRYWSSEYDTDPNDWLPIGEEILRLLSSLTEDERYHWAYGEPRIKEETE